MSKKYAIAQYIPHKGQVEFHKSTAKEVLVVSSIRAGKSFGVINDVLVNSWNDKSGFGTLVCAPTYKLLDSVLERPIVNKLTQFGLLKEHSFSRHETTLKNGNVIYYRSLEEPDIALRGLNISRAYIDEAAYCSAYAIDVVKGRLLTTNGQLKMITTPAGLTNWVYEKYFSDGHLPGVDYVKFNLRDNPIITKEAIDRLLASYDPLLAKQEIEGEFVNLFTNQVYHSFTDDNITDDYQYDPTQPIYIGLDFNIDKNAWVALQKLHNNTFIVISEGYGAKTTADVGQQILTEYGSGAIVVPDATGNNRLQGTAVTNFQLLRQSGVHNVVDTRSNPPRTKRYAVVNATLLNALGQRRLLVSKKCKRLIKELRELSYKPNSDKIEDNNGEKGHITDSLGYIIMYLTGQSVGQITNHKDDFVSNFRAQKQALDLFGF